MELKQLPVNVLKCKLQSNHDEFLLHALLLLLVISSLFYKYVLFGDEKWLQPGTFTSKDYMLHNMCLVDDLFIKL